MFVESVEFVEQGRALRVFEAFFRFEFDGIFHQQAFAFARVEMLRNIAGAEDGERRRQQECGKKIWVNGDTAPGRTGFQSVRRLRVAT